MRLWQRHRCPPDVELTVTINGRIVLGPMTGQHMAYICLYTGGAGREARDVLELDPDATWTYGSVQLLARYIRR
jgi:hypothetical protein